MDDSPQEDAVSADAHEHAPVPFVSSLFVKYLLLFGLVALFPVVAVGYLYFTNHFRFLDEVATHFGGELPGELAELASHIAIQGALVFATFVLLIIAASITASWYFSAPVKKLLEYLRKIRQGEEPPRLLHKGQDELGQLTQTLHTTVETFKTVRERDRELSKTKSDFLSIASHQLRTPLTGLRWVLEQYIGGEGMSAEEQKEIMKKEYETVEYMIHLVDQLLSASQIEEGRFGYSFKKQPLMPLLEKSIEVHTLLAESRQVAITLEHPDAELPEAVFDEKGIEIVLANLVANAIAYSEKGDTVTVSARVDEQGQMLMVSVADTGIGIPEAEKEKLFTKFFRAENARRMQPNGSGLGLYVAKNIVERHGGTIELESKEGEGTRFTFTIPTRAEDIPEEEVEARDFFDSIAAVPE